MTKLYWLLMMGLVVLFTTGCGDDSSETTDTESETETIEDTGDAGDAEVDGLAACTDFLTTSWDHIRDCGGDLAAILPDNGIASGVCSGFCETDGVTVPKADFDDCLAKAGTLECDAIPSDINEVLSQLPEECAFLSDSLNCVFELPEL